MREWMGDVFGEKSRAELDAQPEPAPGTQRGESMLCVIRSGNWNIDHKWARAASRGPAYALSRGGGLGFRLAKTLMRRGNEPPSDGRR
jgi:serine/threonine-protein kinase